MDLLVQFFTHIRETYRPRQGWRKTCIYVGVLFVACIVLFGLLYARFFGPVDQYGAPQEFIVNPDDTYDEVVGELKRLGYIRSSTAFSVAYRATGNLRGIREGGYKISASEDTWTIAHKLAQPPYLAWIRFPTGLRKEQIADVFVKKFGWTEEERVKWIAVDTAPSPSLSEGVYYGDTYLIPSDQNPAQIAARLRDRFSEVFAPYGKQAVEKKIPWTNVLIMASLIEREAGKDDSALISGILWNRLRVGMPLQVDATLQYIRGQKGDWWPVPSPADKKIDSPYNTYMYRGLPPHPIASPSLESIEAALNPEKTSCLYYLHDTKGEIHCSPTYAGQLANVRKYLK